MSLWQSPHGPAWGHPTRHSRQDTSSAGLKLPGTSSLAELGPSPTPTASKEPDSLSQRPLPCCRGLFPVPPGHGDVVCLNYSWVSQPSSAVARDFVLDLCLGLAEGEIKLPGGKCCYLQVVPPCSWCLPTMHFGVLLGLTDAVWQLLKDMNRTA